MYRDRFAPALDSGVDSRLYSENGSTRSGLDNVIGVRDPGEFGHPFCVINEEVVILFVNHAFVPEGRIGISDGARRGFG
jgi:hypothetical protein